MVLDETCIRCYNKNMSLENNFLNRGVLPEPSAVVDGFKPDGSAQLVSGCIELTEQLDPEELRILANQAEDLARMAEGPKVMVEIDPAVSRSLGGLSMLLARVESTPLGVRADSYELGDVLWP